MLSQESSNGARRKGFRYVPPSPRVSISVDRGLRVPNYVRSEDADRTSSPVLPRELPHDGRDDIVDHRNRWGVGELHPPVVLFRADLPACSTPVSANDNHAIAAFEYCPIALA